MKIYSIKNGALNEQDRLDLAQLLVKAGYVVCIGREKPENGKQYRYYVEYKEN